MSITALVRPGPAPPVTAPPTVPSPGRGRPREGRGPYRAGAAVVLVVVMAWSLATFWTGVRDRSPRAPYPAPTAGQAWVRSPQSGQRAFFRLRLPVYGEVPQSATLWFEGAQQATAYVNGYDVAPALVAPDKLIDTAPDIPKGVQTVDIRSALDVGLNVVGLEVVSFDGKAPAFRARVEFTSGGFVQVFGTSPSSWRSTTDAALTGQELPQSGAFARPRLDDGDWVDAVRSSSRPGTDTVTVPPDAYTRSATAPALVAAYGARSLVASRLVDFPGGCSEGWMRVGASGPYTVSIDGRAIAYGPPHLTSPSTTALAVFDLCPVASAGRHVLTVAVSAADQPLAYVDGMVRSGATTSTFATGPGWVLGRDPGAPRTTAAPTLTSPETSMHWLFQRTPGTTSVPFGPLLASRLALTVGILVVLAVAVAVVLASGAALADAVGTVLAGLLPALGVLLVLVETRHIVDVQAPFPYTPGTLALVLGTALGGVVLSVGFAVLGPRRGRARRSGKGPRHVAGAGPSWLGRHWYGAAVVLFTGGWCVAQSYDIMFNPLWQDELSSLAAAQGMRAHLVPQWPSGFLYWKSELYSALIAVVGGVTHDDPSVLREISVLWLGATVLLFGLVLMPMLLPRRRLWQLASTVVFATAPFELGHATDIRMYQMVQCVVVVVAILLLKAIERPTTRRIAALMAAVVAMYLTHEESFGVLLIVPLALCFFGGLRWARNWRWWVFGGLAIGVIGAQLLLVVLTHPPIFGVDPSNGPLVAWSPEPFYYLANYFFTGGASGASITLVSSLAVVGVVTGFVRRDALRIYLSAFWIVPTVVVSVALATKDTRYVFLCLPFVFALAACGTSDILGWVRGVVVRGRHPEGTAVRERLVGVLALCSVAAIMLSLIGGLNDYGTFTGSLFGANVSRRWLDYPTAVAYVKAHRQPGDEVIAAATPNLVGYSLGSPPDYWIPTHRTEALLYVFEKHGEAVDTQYGIPTIFNAQDLEDALEGAHRVWLVGADSVIRSLVPAMRQVVQRQFVLEEEGEYVSVFLATS
ncbi:MAG TPA: hypothetical protein VMB72_11220 [Acidimicrobiales bacterium]|nr:hypothetical protein [Acidimicrobiales bacterium]